MVRFVLIVQDCASSQSSHSFSLPFYRETIWYVTSDELCDVQYHLLHRVWEQVWIRWPPIQEHGEKSQRDHTHHRLCTYPGKFHICFLNGCCFEGTTNQANLSKQLTILIYVCRTEDKKSNFVVSAALGQVLNDRIKVDGNCRYLVIENTY